MWITPIQLLGEISNYLIVHAPDPIRTWVERRYLQVLDDHAHQINRAGIRFRATVSRETLRSPQPPKTLPE